MEHAYFPVAPEQMAGVIDYHDLVEGTVEIGDVRVTTQYLNHPALTLGYRLEGDGVTIVHAADHEPFDRALAAGGDFSGSHQDLAHAAFFDGADLLIHDTQYLAEEYPAHVGWGHSTAEYVVGCGADGRGARGWRSTTTIPGGPTTRWTRWWCGRGPSPPRLATRARSSRRPRDSTSSCADGHPSAMRPWSRRRCSRRSRSSPGAC